MPIKRFLESTFLLLLAITIYIKICKSKQRQKSAFLHLLKIVVVSGMEEKEKNVPERRPYESRISIAHKILSGDTSTFMVSMGFQVVPIAARLPQHITIA